MGRGERRVHAVEQDLDDRRREQHGAGETGGEGRFDDRLEGGTGAEPGRVAARPRHGHEGCDHGGARRRGDHQLDQGRQRQQRACGVLPVRRRRAEPLPCRQRRLGGRWLEVVRFSGRHGRTLRLPPVAGIRQRPDGRGRRTAFGRPVQGGGELPLLLPRRLGRDVHDGRHAGRDGQRERAGHPPRHAALERHVGGKSRAQQGHLHDGRRGQSAWCA